MRFKYIVVSSLLAPALKNPALLGLLQVHTYVLGGLTPGSVCVGSAVTYGLRGSNTSFRQALSLTFQRGVTAVVGIPLLFDQNRLPDVRSNSLRLEVERRVR